MEYSVDKILYSRLHALRTQIKNKEKKEQGKAPTVCTDAALHNIAEMRPTTLSELSAVNGIGEAFALKYGQQFINIINRTLEENTETTIMNKSMRYTLKELEKKLVNINKRNKMLYMPKLSKKIAADISDTHSCLDLLFGRSKKMVIPISNITLDEETGELIEEPGAYAKIKPLITENESHMRETGANLLYIAYPWAIGKLPAEDFTIRAPLVLWPVAYETTANSVILTLDEERDIVYNTTLLLANQKVCGKNQTLPESFSPEPNAASFLQNLYQFYMDNDFNLQYNGDELPAHEQKFVSYKAGEFPNFPSGEVHLMHNVVFGRFNVIESAIRADIESLLDGGMVNEPLAELLAVDDESNDVLDIDFDEPKPATEPTSTSEHNIVYINSLDASQENVLQNLAHTKTLVIQGPPGTGKSQVIASIIANAINQKKTVLMVSEKKTALDVVYSRLGHLHKFALLVDDANNKADFYRQMNNMFQPGYVAQTPRRTVPAISGEIDECIQNLQAIEDTVYKPNSKHGASMYDIYHLSREYSVPCDVASLMLQLRPDVLEKIGFQLEALQQLHDAWQKPDKTRECLWYMDYRGQFPWMKQLTASLDSIDAGNVHTNLERYKAEGATIEAKNIFAKLFQRPKHAKQVQQYLSTICGVSGPALAKEFLENPEPMLQSSQNVPRFMNARAMYHAEAEASRWYLSLIKFAATLCDQDLAQANDIVYKCLLDKWIAIFEQDHAPVMDSIREFDEIRATIDELRQEKTTACIRNMYGMCTSNMVGLADLKRYKEMQRIIQSKRRWSVGRFVKKYSMELLKFVKVWMMTPEIVSEILPLTNELFDIVIFDEASQLYVEKGVPAISRGKQIIIAGDHKQLKPSSLGIGRMEYMDEVEEQAVNYGALEEESLLDLARFRYKNVMLNYHYRAKYEELINFSNYAFYNGKLFVSPNMTIPEKPPIEVHYTENALWRGRNNIEEAKYIIALLKDFFATRKGSETVGIITFNTNQRDLILQMLEQACRDDAIFASQVNTEKMRTKDGEDIGLFVKNIENVQGDERDVIIFSIGYAKNTSGKLVHNFGWLNQDGGENRLNVAISRAKEKIHIVQSFRPDELHVEAAKNEGPRIFKKYLEYAEAISTGNKKAEKEILLSFGDTLAEDDNVRFDSPFEEQVYDALVERGYQVHSQIGVGGYSIDLAIKKDGKYLLGIECDGALYHSSATAKERDYYRQKYLETRGWTIHRIWSSNWWRDPQAEVEKICAKVQQIAGGPAV